ncbi:basic proline-rich protein [Zalerion maritima]|uniref:Basic proline-rich protein n=1 Tax=Zalerion maritima TaxID=339359 RepID=A0AAD5RLI5_9PEZI|nr:basic proline-rich protein [Zalerion maritima]
MMEPVPETERMEEFRPNPTPSLRIKNPASVSTFDLESTRQQPPSPSMIRRSADPAPSSPSSPAWAPPVALPYRPRTTSPLSGAHSRSRSTASYLAPPMARTKSMPGVNGSGHILVSTHGRPASPSGQSPARVRAPRKQADEVFPTSPVRSSVLDHDRQERVVERKSSPNLPTGTFSRNSSRRPSSPLRQPSSSSMGALPSTVSSSTSSPMLRSYDSSTNSWSYAASFPSSVPSTPTSLRSRSPSISSLETIPDSPDAEEAALEAERIAQLKAAAEGSDSDTDSDSNKSRSSLDVPNRGRTLGFGSRDKRKRWSVCGAERRGDIDLETIWED